MPSPAAAQVFRSNQELLAAWTADPAYGIEDFRRIFDAFLAGLAIPTGATFTPVDAGGVPAIWADAAGVDTDRVVILFHAGGLVMGTAQGYRSCGAYLSAATGARVLLVDFRLAPESPFPAQLDDALASYRWVLAQGTSPGSVVIAGDSAGGGLAMSTLLALRDSGAPLPAAGLAVSPLADWTASGDSMTTNADSDPLLPGPGMVLMLRPMLVGDDEVTNPYVSAVFGDYRGLPPLLVLAGSIEVLRDDGKRIVEAAQRAGVDAEFVEGEAMVHIWPVFADRLPEAREALDRIGAFVRKHLS